MGKRIVYVVASSIKSYNRYVNDVVRLNEVEETLGTTPVYANATFVLLSRASQIGEMMFHEVKWLDCCVDNPEFNLIRDTLEKYKELVIRDADNK